MTVQFTSARRTDAIEEFSLARMWQSGLKACSNDAPLLLGIGWLILAIPAILIILLAGALKLPRLAPVLLIPLIVVVPIWFSANIYMAGASLSGKPRLPLFEPPTRIVQGGISVFVALLASGLVIFIPTTTIWVLLQGIFGHRVYTAPPMLLTGFTALYVSSRLSFVLPSALFEQRTFAAFSESWQLTEGRLLPLGASHLALNAISGLIWYIPQLMMPSSLPELILTAAIVFSMSLVYMSMYFYVFVAAYRMIKSEEDVFDTTIFD